MGTVCVTVEGEETVGRVWVGLGLPPPPRFSVSLCVATVSWAALGYPLLLSLCVVSCLCSDMGEGDWTGLIVGTFAVCHSGTVVLSDWPGDDHLAAINDMLFGSMI